ncbi:MAG TPA: putative Ig domain-containing protein [Gaiellaceae bacterium]|nr:putative Ig domain-containing protein [Gaiellaceae bacterium]
MRRAVALVAASAFVLLAASGAGARPSAPGLTHVTLIGDSVPEGITGSTIATRIISQGVDIDLEPATCRRLEDPSCPPNPPTAIQLIQSKGSSIGPVVIVAVGYNDFANHYQQEMNDVIAALDAAGVKRIFWLTLRAAHHSYIPVNDEIKATAAAHPNMTVIDWNLYSRDHPDWFQSDGIHMLEAGSEAMATLIHDKLLAAGVAVPPPVVATRSIPAASVGRRYAVTLRARSGRGPYRWAALGHVPLGLHMSPGGTLAGVPRRTDAHGVYTLVFRVTDATGQSGTRKLLLRLR